MTTEWRLEERHNFEPGAVAPQLRWRVTTKTHEDAMPRIVALVAVEADARLATAAPKMQEALNCWKDVYTTHVRGKPIKAKLNKAWRMTAQALHEAEGEKEEQP